MRMMELKNYIAKKENDLLIELIINNCIIEEPIESLMLNKAEEQVICTKDLVQNVEN